MIKLRLQRRGRKRRPFYHIVVADSRSPRDGRVIERLGLFDNVSENKKVTYNEDRVIHWLKIGAQPSDTVRNILKKEGILYKMHLMRWGKSEEEIETALEAWREARETKGEENVSRKVKQKELLKTEEGEYKKQAEEKAAAAAKEQELKKAEEEKAKAEAEEAAAKEKAEEAAKKAPAEEETKEVAEEAPAEEKTEEAAEETPAEEVTKEAPAEEESKEAPAEEVAEEVAEEAPAEEKTEEIAASSTEMNANEAIEHIKNSTLEELEGFVTDAEDRVTVQRAWETKQSED